MKKYLLSTLIVVIMISITGCGLHAPVKHEKHLEQQVIYHMIKSDVGKPIPTFPEETKLDFDYIVETYGDLELGEWVEVSNPEMITEYVFGRWKPVCIQQEDTYYKYDEKLVGKISADISRKGISYVLGDTVQDTVSCTLVNKAVVTEEGFSLTVTDYGCLVYEDEYYSIILSKEK